MSKIAPLVGIGIDYKYKSSFTNKFNEFIINNQNRLSHISVVGIESDIQALKFKADFSDIPIIHHLSNVSPGDLDGPNLKRLNKLDNISKLISAKWACEDIGVWSINDSPLPYFISPILNLDWAKCIGKRIQSVVHHSSIPFFAEVPAFSTECGEATLGSFFKQIVNECSVGIVLDISHIFSYCIASKRGVLEVLDEFPCDMVREFHIAGGKMSLDGRYLDTHSHQIMDEIYDVLKVAIGRCDNLKAVTFEVSHNLEFDTFKKDFMKIHHLLENETFRPRF